MAQVNRTIPRRLGIQRASPRRLVLRKKKRPPKTSSRIARVVRGRTHRSPQKKRKRRKAHRVQRSKPQASRTEARTAQVSRGKVRRAMENSQGKKRKMGVSNRRDRHSGMAPSKAAAGIQKARRRTATIRSKARSSKVKINKAIAAKTILVPTQETRHAIHSRLRSQRPTSRPEGPEYQTIPWLRMVPTMARQWSES